MQGSLEVFEKHESEARSYCRSFPVVFKKAVDSIVYDTTGKKYIDFLSGAGALNYGHNNQIIKKSVMSYLADDGILMSLDLHTQAKKEFIEAFQRVILAPRHLSYKMQFTSPTGTSVVESAIKLARKSTGRENIVAFTNAFHGMSGNSLSLTGNQHNRQNVSYGSVSRFPYDGYIGGNFDSLAYYRKLLTDKSSGIDLPAAFILETLQGEGGLNLCSTAWLQGLSKLAKEFGILLIIDDVQAGCGRTGTFFSFERANIKPDMVCMSKSIGGIGLPMALLLIAEENDVWLAGEDNGTFRGNNLAFIAAKAMIDNYWSDSTFEIELEEKSDLIKKFCESIQLKHSEYVKSTRGMGFMQGLEFSPGKVTSTIIKECFERGLIIESCGAEDQVIKIFPPLTIDQETLKKGLSILDEVVDSCFTPA